MCRDEFGVENEKGSKCHGKEEPMKRSEGEFMQPNTFPRLGRCAGPVECGSVNGHVLQGLKK